MLSRIVLSLIPVFLTPLILWGIFNFGSDKTPILIIPWFMYCVVYAIALNFLFKRFASRALLFIVAVLASIIASYVLALVLLYSIS